MAYKFSNLVKRGWVQMRIHLTLPYAMAGYSCGQRNSRQPRARSLWASNFVFKSDKWLVFNQGRIEYVVVKVGL